MLFLHITAAVLGIVSSTLRSLLFVKKGVLNPYLQRITLVSLFILSVTGIGLLFGKLTLLHSPAFLLKMFFVAALLVSEFYLIQKKSTLAVFTSLFTWFSSFFWSELEGIGFSHLVILGLYFGVVLLMAVVFKLKNELSLAP